jgi:hypothetical protein
VGIRVVLWGLSGGGHYTPTPYPSWPMVPLGTYCFVPQQFIYCFSDYFVFNQESVMHVEFIEFAEVIEIMANIPVYEVVYILINEVVSGE